VVSGPYTFSPTPATTVDAVTGADYTNDFLPNDPTTVASGIQTVFGLSSAPSLTANNESLTNPFTESVPMGYDYVAIHQDSGELLFFYNSIQTSFTLTNSGGTLSNARFYNAVPAPAIGHGLPVILALGGLVFGAKLWERSKKRFSVGTAAA